MSEKDETNEIVTAAVPIVLAICATVIACFALVSSSSDSVKIAFAGAAGTGLGAAAGLGRSPNARKDKPGVGQIENAENVDVSMGDTGK